MANPALTPRRAANASTSASSDSDSQLKLWMPLASAYSTSSAVLPTPENTTFPGSPPACSTRYSSPPETISNPAPAFASSASTASDEFAFTA